MIELDPRFKRIFVGVIGSQLYGTALPTSDTDYRGVFIPSEEFYIGLLENVEQVESKVPDETYWEIKKFFKLCLDCNPNIVELLFVPLESTKAIFYSKEWEEIIRNRNIFLSSKAKHTFSGYAVAQLHRIKQHREWLLHPPSHKPTRQEFGLPDANTITKDQIGAFDELLALNEPIKVGDEIFETLRREKAFINANTYWNKYQEWKTNRNPKRAELETKFFYDTKHASHLYRLLSEGKELLTTGKITFPRPDAEELLSIIKGKYSYDELISKVGGGEIAEKGIDTFFRNIESEVVLPHSPDRKAADALCQKLIKNRINNQ